VGLRSERFRDSDKAVFIESWATSWIFGIWGTIVDKDKEDFVRVWENLWRDDSREDIVVGEPGGVRGLKIMNLRF
tara:strand:- start:757 stop:981 length:225 start_codon:yes stop_codon:yes gene_type:complete